MYIICVNNLLKRDYHKRHTRLFLLLHLTVYFLTTSPPAITSLLAHRLGTNRPRRWSDSLRSPVLV
jgi:hypothetical protein